MSDTLRRQGSARGRAFRALCLARVRETYRESEVIFWSFVFPIVLAIGLGIAFRNRPADKVDVGLLDGPGSSAIAKVLESVPTFHVRMLKGSEAGTALRMGRVALVIVAAPEGPRYRLDPTRPESMLARAEVDDALQRAAGRTDPLHTKDEPMSEPGGRYIDFLIPGILGMNIMSGGMWGVGFHLVDMRIKKLLKRLVATPMRRGDFLLSQMTIRVGFVFFEVSFLLWFARLTFDVPILGSWVTIMFLGVLGALCFGGIGLLVASRASTIEKVSGLMNVVMMPMFVCSGIFFSAERFPDVVQPIIQALPLTALINALRAVTLEGASAASQVNEILILVIWAVLSFSLGLRRFRWD